jgi:CTP synthase (UTP-ammonia lyase)
MLAGAGPANEVPAVNDGSATEHVDLAVIGDRSESYLLHRQSDEAIDHAARFLNLTVSLRWISPTALEDGTGSIQDVSGLFFGPAPVPYSSFKGVLTGLQFGREQHIPTLATCGGCQHAVLEYAQNVLKLDGVRHAGLNPTVADPVVSPLVCSLVGKAGTVQLRSGSHVAGIYPTKLAEELYACSYGINPEYEGPLEAAGLSVVGRDNSDQVARVFELADHPFYVATLYVPQAQSLPTAPHPLIVAFVRAVHNKARERSADSAH